MSGQTIKVVVAVVVLAVAAVVILRSLSGESRRGEMPDMAWFYDLENGELFTAASERIPPIGTPSDPGSNAGVRAHVYSCGSCDESERRIMYLERYSDDARQAMEQINTLEDEQQKAPLWPVVQAGQHVAAVPDAGGDPQWTPMQSERGKALTKAFWTMCGEAGRGSLCPPQ